MSDSYILNPITELLGFHYTKKVSNNQANILQNMLEGLQKNKADLDNVASSDLNILNHNESDNIQNNIEAEGLNEEAIDANLLQQDMSFCPLLESYDDYEENGYEMDLYNAQSNAPQLNNFNGYFIG